MSRKKVTNPEALLCLKNNKYYLFSDLENVFNIRASDAERIKDFIMKKFWLGKLKYSLVSFHQVWDKKLSEEGTELPKVVFCREAFRSLFIEKEIKENGTKINFKNGLFIDLDDKFYKKFAQIKWRFYAEEISSALKQREECEKYNQTENGHTTFILLYLPYLAIHIEDLKCVLRENRISSLVEKLPTLKKGKANKKISTVQRDKEIFTSYKSLNALNPSKSDSEIAKEIAPKFGMEASRVRNIIVKHKRLD